jgi:hypothetical protein
MQFPEQFPEQSPLKNNAPSYPGKTRVVPLGWEAIDPHAAWGMENRYR